MKARFVIHHVSAGGGRGTPFSSRFLQPVSVLPYLSPMSKRVALPKAIKTIREAKQLPGARVAIAALMSHAHLINIEAGRRSATEPSIELLAAALGVDVDAISYVTSEAKSA